MSLPPKGKKRRLKRRWMLGGTVLAASLAALALAAFAAFAFRHAENPWPAIGAAAALAAAAVLISVFANLCFIRTVTDPIRTLTALAQRISDGSYGIQTDKQRDDEIGDLTDSINEMSARIAQGEKLQSEFVSSVSHELRTPLTAITGWAETLAYDEAIQGDSRKGLNIITKESARLTKMVEELLEFTRMQDGRFNLNVETIDAAAEIEDAVFTYAKLFKQDSIDLVYIPCDGDVPLIDGDAERLKQVFLNIIDNAAKYGRSGGRIEVSVKWDDEKLMICVRDFGRGIPEDELPHVKERFYKGSSRERGSGIGLAVCEEIVSRHGGELIIENASEGGVLATVCLPIKK